MELILIRHGETTWNKDGRVQGLSDIELSGVGLNQAQKLALSIQDINIKAVYSSPLKRAYQTAQIINKMHNAPIYLEPGLMEMDQGDFEGLSFQELKACNKDFLQRWIQDPAFVTMPNGESLAELQKRAWPVVAEIIDKAENALIVSHSFTIAAILCKVQNISLSQFRKVCVGTASKTIVSFQNGSALIDVLNDRTHLNMDGL
ncbi:MAG: histidine phosphatase family protein [Syntrophales bacterium]